jgi:3-phosphoshikimate 1-carboxyvinyltransferase
MGAQIIGVGPTQTPPLVVTGRELHGIEYSLPVASAQVKSAILLAGLSATGTTTVREPSPTRSHTEEMLAQAGAAIEIHHDGSLTTITLEPSTLVAQRWIIPADPSNAAFFIVAGLLVAHGSITCEGVYAGPARTGFLDVLERMGASVDRQLVAATVLDITARPHSLTGTDVQAEEIPSLDEIPILVVAACAATGTTRFFDAGELRIKESDRFEACLDLAGALGARAWSDAETLCVEGLGGADAFNHLEFDARGDHRMALAASVAAVVGNGGVVHGFESIETNYPQFLADLERLT